MATTSTLRGWWDDYACRPDRMTPHTSFGFTSLVANPSLEAWVAFDATLEATGYRPKSSWCYTCRNIKDSSKLSLHSYGIARDIDPFALGNPFVGGAFSWDRTRFTKAQIDAVYAIETTEGARVFSWGGFWRNRKDYMHFQLDVRPSALAAGIDWSTVGGDAPAGGPAATDHTTTLATTASHPTEEEEMASKIGDEGGDIGRLQDMLRRAGFDPGATDEVFGPLTKRALEDFQRAEGLTVNGVAGPGTWALLAVRFVST